MWWVHDKYFYWEFQSRVPWVGKMKKYKFQKIEFLMMCQIRVPKFWNYIAHALKVILNGSVFETKRSISGIYRERGRMSITHATQQR